MINRLLIHSQQLGVLPLTSRCNFRCVFCSRSQNPASILTFDISDRSLVDLWQAIDDLRAPGRVIIGESATLVNEGEPLCHPNWRQVLIRVRDRHPGTDIALTTNARLLEPTDGQLLADLGVRVTVSLNYVADRWRRQLLGDDDPRWTLAMIERLAEAGVIMEGSVVALTGITGNRELRAALEFLDQINISVIRVFVPGWTRKGRADVVAGAPRRSELIEMCGDIRTGLRSAVIVEPGEVEDLRARVEDVIPGSVAEKIGVSRGDIMVKINRRQVTSRTEARRLLNGDVRRIHVERNRRRVELVGYGRPVDGAVMYSDLSRSVLRRLKRAVEGGSAAVICSRPARKLVDHVLSEMRAEVNVVTCRSAVFGGNICAAGLLTFSDVARALRGLSGFDRVVVPKVFTDLDGRDMEGRSSTDLEHVTGVPVILV